MVRYLSIYALLAFAVQESMMAHKMDEVTEFLNGMLNDEIYMERPSGYIKDAEEHLACRLKRSLHGLKQFSRCRKSVS